MPLRDTSSKLRACSTLRCDRKNFYFPSGGVLIAFKQNHNTEMNGQKDPNLFLPTPMAHEFSIKA